YALVVLEKKRNLKRKQRLMNAEDMGESVYQDALQILDRARADSLKILSRAQLKAQNVLKSTYSISQESRKELDTNLLEIYKKQEESLEEINKELLQSYKYAVQQGKEDNIRTLYETTEAMKKEALSGVDELKEAIKEETLGARQALEDKIQTEYLKVEHEADIYKQEKIKNLNKRIFDMLSEIYSKVIMQDLDQIKHEKLILELLKEEIRKSGMDRGVDSALRK
ncbi:MAG: hypothetical protein WAX66_00035, partial [Patescibacteria group bacterium]